MKRVLLGLVALSLIAAAGAGLAYQRYLTFLSTPVVTEDDLVFFVPKGKHFGFVVNELTELSLIDSDLGFKVLSKHKPQLTRIRAGEFLIPKGSTPEQLLDVLVNGKPIQYKVTLVEGSTVKELLAVLAKDPVLRKEVSEKPYEEAADMLKGDYERPEGLFLAETYHFERGASDLNILNRAKASLNQILANEWQKRDTKLPYKTAYEALTMASIIEKETARADERPTIAGVFVRRLNKKMRLQTDPTVIYGMGDNYNGNITRKDLRRPTAYNTYTIAALPPTPIATVGKEAIVAALNPADGKALYFVAKGDGSHQFSATLREHNAAVREYQLKRRKDYRSSP